MKRCFRCGIGIDIEKPGRRDECPSCRTDLHVCLNCTFYDPVRSNECREPQAEQVKEKDRANFCDYVRFKESEDKKTSDKATAEALWDQLFRKT